MKSPGSSFSLAKASVNITTANPHVLCLLCRDICESSRYFQAYTTYGHSEKPSNLFERVEYNKHGYERWSFWSYNELQKSSDNGCHLCTMLLSEAKRLNLIPPVAKRDKPLRMKTRLNTYYFDFRMQLKLEADDVSKEIRDKGEHQVELASFVGVDLFRKRCNLVSSIGNSANLASERMGFEKGEFSIQLAKKTTVENTTAMIQFWLNQCSSSHQQCQCSHAFIASALSRPTRLLDVSDPNYPRLILGKDISSATVDYLTLSHCWGQGGEIITKLTDDNMEAYMERLPLTCLSQTFLDAMAVTRELGYQFLWIDALCIVQNSADDWAREGSRMSEVYGNALLNIAACNPSRDAGLFDTRNPLAYYPCEVVGQECSMFMVPAGIEFPAHLPLFSRGWILQERYLSRRTIYFGAGELYWECFEGIAGETFPRGPMAPNGDFVSGRTVYNSQKKKSFAKLLSKLGSQNVDTHDGLAAFIKRWTSIAQTHAALQLTVPSDRIASLAGITSVVSRRVEMSEQQYVAGMWLFTLPMTLLWWLDAKPLRDLPIAPNIPSWSCMKIHGTLRHSSSIDLEYEKYCNKSSPAYAPGPRATLLGCSIARTEGPSAIVGEAAEARLHLRGVLRRITKLMPCLRCCQLGCSCNTCAAPRSEFEQSRLHVRLDAPIEGEHHEFYCFSILNTQQREEGLVLLPRSAGGGYIRVGFLTIRIKSGQKNPAYAADPHWGEGHVEEIFLY